MVTITLYARQQKRHRCIEQSFGFCGRGRGWDEGGMIWENGTETCILSYVKHITSPGSMHDIGFSGLVHWDDPEGWDGEGSGRGFRMGNMCTPMADSCQCMAKPIQYCKVIRLQLKFFNVCFLTIKKKKESRAGHRWWTSLFPVLYTALATSQEVSESWGWACHPRV